MQRIFFLRAFGDFVIGMHAISKSKQPIHVVASLHLKPLYDALVKAQVISTNAYYTIVFEYFGIQSGQLSFFTNKQLLSLATFSQLQKIKKYALANPNHKGQDWVEQDIRLSLFNFLTGAHCKAVVGKGARVYQGYHNWLAIEEQISQLEKPYKQVLILPDARQVKKEIPKSTLTLLKAELEAKGIIVQIARFNNNQMSSHSAELSYDNFDTLIQLIQQADFIITADSLPAHLAQAMQKPHNIIYNQNGVNRFCTPYVWAQQ